MAVLSCNSEPALLKAGPHTSFEAEEWLIVNFPCRGKSKLRLLARGYFERKGKRISGENHTSEGDSPSE